MKVTDYDILIVGAGPAGSVAARAAAEAGMRVLVVERRNRVGIPVQCAEFIPAMLLGQLDIQQRDFIAQKTEGMLTFLPGEPVHQTPAPGYVIHRDLFDQVLADTAVLAGAELLTGTHAVSLDNSGVVTLKNLTRNSFYVRAKVIIGADGPQSTVGKWAGVVNDHLLSGVQVTLPLCRPLTCTEVYFEHHITGGYGWLFPKGDVANVGLGVTKDAMSLQRPRLLLNKLVERLVTEGKVEENSLAYAAGWIPAVPMRSAVAGNIILTGDAAGHTHAITGAGIFTAISTGKMAGGWAARAVEENDLAILKKYDEEWQDLFGDTLQLAAERRSLMEESWDDFDTIIKRCWVAFREYYANDG